MTEITTNPIPIVEIPLESILWQDFSTQLRVQIDGDQVDNLIAAFEAGADLPPIDVFFLGSPAQTGDNDYLGDGCYIADGWHRVTAARLLKRETIMARIHAGGRIEAIKWALGANATHGLRRTNKDKRKAVEVAVREFSKLSNRAIADLCHVHPSTVDDIRPQLPDSGSSHIGKDGKTRHAKAATQLDFFEILGREWKPAEKSLKLTLESVAWLSDTFPVEQKLEAANALLREVDGWRASLIERKRALTESIGKQPAQTENTEPAPDLAALMPDNTGRAE